MKKMIVDILNVLGGTLLMALATQCVFDPIGLVTGGFLGLGIIVKNLTEPFVEGGVPLWLTNLVLNIPLFLAAWFRMGRNSLLRVIAATFLLSGWLSVIPSVDLAEGDYLIAALFGGIVFGTGMGMVFRAGASTGGTDTLAMLVHTLLPQYTLARILQIIDGVIVIAGAFVFGIRPTLYAVAAIYIMEKVTDGVMAGFSYSQGVYIISEQYEKVSERILHELDRGLTGLSAKGMYTNQEKCLLYCVVSRKELYALKEIIRTTDPNAFVIVSDVREVLGEGFLEYTKN